MTLYNTVHVCGKPILSLHVHTLLLLKLLRFSVTPCWRQTLTIAFQCSHLPVIQSICRARLTPRLLLTSPPLRQPTL